MDERELRIGNFVDAEISNGEETLEITNGSITGILNDSLYLNTFKFEYRHLRPIPLTTEWLIKFGFGYTDGGEAYECIWGFKGFKCWQHDTGFCHDFMFGGDIDYVHQLQNMYYALAGEELIVI